ncbi:designed dimeric coiled coil peptide peptide [Caudoviricetes sp.]|nr:designed dimeric coiled coil peptide peptide [Caudoviricetes sp.]
MSAERQAFVDWFRSLKPEEAVEVWWECDAMTAAEVRSELERLKGENAALRARLSELESANADVVASMRDERDAATEFMAEVDGLRTENAALRAVVEAARPIVKFAGDNYGETVADELDRWDLALAALDRLSKEQA